MSLADWEFLNSLPFGSVIFSRPRAGSMSMPERIASGDLDGDLYLICWDFALLSCMNNVDAMVDQPIEDDGVLKTVPSNPRWLEEARDVMTNVTAFADIGALIGKLYTKSMKVAKESKLKKEDPDAAALAVAFNEALEYKKHGRPIRLPSDLIDQMPKRFRYLLTPL
jgi:RNA-dependent RNA polymerase